MAFVLEKEREFEFALSYQGPTAVLQFEFSFLIFGGADTLAVLLDTALFSIGVLPEIQANYLTYTIEVDHAPLPDRYRVTITLAGEVDQEAEGTIGPFPFSQLQRPQALFAIPPLVAIVAALGIALLFAVIAWKVLKGGLWGLIFGGGGGGLSAPYSAAVALGAVALGLYFIFGRRNANA